MTFNNSTAAKRTVHLALVVFAVAFAVRLTYFVELQSTPYFDPPSGADSSWHHEWARDIASGKQAPAEPFFRAPLYPYFLGTVYRLTGASVSAAAFAQLLLGVVSCLLTFNLGRMMFGNRIGVAAGIVTAFYGPAMYFEGELLTTALSVPLNLLMLNFLVLPGHLTVARALSAGTVLGLSAITRPDIVLFYPFALAFLFIRNRHEQQRRTSLLPALFCIVAILPPTAVTLRNHIVGNDGVFICSQAGVNFYIGNHEEASGKSVQVPGLAPREGSWNVFVKSTHALAEQKAGHPLKPSGSSRFWFGEGLRFMRDNPGQAALLLLRKTYYFWNGYEIPNNRSLYFFSGFVPILKPLVHTNAIAFPFGLLAPLGLIGLAMNLNKKNKSWLLAIFMAVFGLENVLFFTCARFRIPMVHVMALFACTGVVALRCLVQDRRWRRFTAAFAAVIAIGVVCNSRAWKAHDEPHAWNESSLAQAYSRKGDYGQASFHYEESLLVAPHQSGVRHKLGNAYSKLGRYAEAIVQLERALDGNPDDPVIYNDLGQNYAQTGNLEKAGAAFGRAAELDPDSQTIRDNLSRVERLLELLNNNLTSD